MERLANGSGNNLVARLWLRVTVKTETTTDATSQAHNGRKCCVLLSAVLTGSLSRYHSACSRRVFLSSITLLNMARSSHPTSASSWWIGAPSKTRALSSMI